MHRKLPRQVDSSKVEFLANWFRYSTGVRSPSESWVRFSLYSIIHQPVDRLADIVEACKQMLIQQFLA